MEERDGEGRRRRRGRVPDEDFNAPFGIYGLFFLFFFVSYYPAMKCTLDLSHLHVHKAVHDCMLESKRKQKSSDRKIINELGGSSLLLRLIRQN